MAGGFLFLLLITLVLRGSSEKSYLNSRRRELQKILDKENAYYLKEKYCNVQVGPYGTYLRFVFTVIFTFNVIASSSC